MSTFLDDIFGPITSDLLNTLGKGVTLTRNGSPTYDPTTGAVSTTQVQEQLKAVVEYADPQKWEPGLVTGDARQLSIAGADVSPAPAPGDVFTVDSIDFTIPAKGGVKPIYSGENVALYIVLVARG